MDLNLKEQQKQTQIQKLVMTQQIQQSLRILRYSSEDLKEYLTQKTLDNPFISIKDNKKYDIEQTIPKISDKRQSLFSYLLDQVGLTMRKTKLRSWVIYLIEHLDTNGYLKVDLEKISENQTILIDALTLLQQLDPPGVGARDLKECLLLQIDRDKFALDKVYEIVQTDFQDLIDKKWSKISKKYELQAEDIQKILDYLKRLSAAPGAIYKQTYDEYVVPDLILDKKVNLKLTSNTVPEILFKEKYYNELKNNSDSEVIKYLLEKKKDYQILKNDVLKRGETLLKIGNEIVEKQLDFFIRKNNILKPLLLRDVAQKLKIHESTVSRAINGKFIKYDGKIFELKYFFARPVNGKEETSEMIKRAIRNLIDNENKKNPLSDQKICDILANEGFKISRRVIGKYREELHIKNSTKRKH